MMKMINQNPLQYKPALVLGVILITAWIVANGTRPDWEIRRYAWVVVAATATTMTFYGLYICWVRDWLREP